MGPGKDLNIAGKNLAYLVLFLLFKRQFHFNCFSGIKKCSPLIDISNDITYCTNYISCRQQQYIAHYLVEKNNLFNPVRLLPKKVKKCSLTFGNISKNVLKVSGTFLMYYIIALEAHFTPLVSQPAFTYSKLSIETKEQGVKYVQS